MTVLAVVLKYMLFAIPIMLLKWPWKSNAKTARLSACLYFHFSDRFERFVVFNNYGCVQSSCWQFAEVPQTVKISELFKSIGMDILRNITVIRFYILEYQGAIWWICQHHWTNWSKAKHLFYYFIVLKTALSKRGTAQSSLNGWQLIYCYWFITDMFII